MKNIRTATNIEASVLFIYNDKTEARLIFARNYAKPATICQLSFKVREKNRGKSGKNPVFVKMHEIILVWTCNLFQFFA